MIISMNATVCGDMTMVSNGRFKIFGSDEGEECARAKKVAVNRVKRNFRLVLEVMVLAGSRGAGEAVSGAGACHVWLLGVREPFGLLRLGCLNLALGLAGSC
jgi:hypothetical protein